MQKTILQVPIDKVVKQTAEQAATRQGFSSLQEIVRVFLTQLANQKISVTLREAVQLSKTNEKRYIAMTKDFEAGENIHTAKSTSALITQLHNDN